MRRGDRRESARCSAATISAVSSTDSVVWVTKASWPGSRGVKASASATVSISVDRACGQLAHGADHLGVAGVADQHDLAAGAMMALGLHMHLGDQRAGGVEDRASRRACAVGRHRLRHAVGGEHHRPVVGALVQLLDEHRAQRLQPLDHVAVVDDLVAHIDRRAVLLDGAARRSGWPGRRRRRSRAARPTGLKWGVFLAEACGLRRTLRAGAGACCGPLEGKLSRPDADCLGAG